MCALPVTAAASLWNREILGKMRFLFLQPESPFPAGQGDQRARLRIIIRGLPRRLALLVNRPRSASHQSVERPLVVFGKRLPGWSHMNPEEVGLTGGMRNALNTFLCHRGKLRFRRLGVTNRGAEK